MAKIQRKQGVTAFTEAAVCKAAAKRRSAKTIALWLDNDVIEHFQAGKGWQVRINAALCKAAGL